LLQEYLILMIYWMAIKCKRGLYDGLKVHQYWGAFSFHYLFHILLHFYRVHQQYQCILITFFVKVAIFRVEARILKSILIEMTKNDVNAEKIGTLLKYKRHYLD